MDCEMTENATTVLRDKLLTHRALLLDHAAQQADVDPLSWSWLRMLGDAQAALAAVDEENADHRVRVVS